MRHRNFELTDKQEQYCAWEATPRGERNPKTYEQMAEYLGVTHPTLYRWRKNPLCQERTLEIVREAVGGPERVRAVLDVLYDEAFVHRNIKAMETFLKYAGVLVDRREVRSVEPDEAELDDEALAAELEDAAVEAAEAILAKRQQAK